MATAERKRELGTTVRERLAETAEDEAERIARVYLEAMEATDGQPHPPTDAHRPGPLVPTTHPSRAA